MYFEKTSIYAKTDKGAEEVRTRAMRLRPPLRAVLIMVDGSSLEQLRRRNGDPPDLDGSLRWLEEAGLVERRRDALALAPLPEVSRVPAPPATSAPIVQSGSRRKSNALARLYLLDIMERTLGTGSDPARNRLRVATSREDILAAWRDLRPILAEVGGEERAVRIEAEFRGQLPD